MCGCFLGPFNLQFPFCFVFPMRYSHFFLHFSFDEKQIKNKNPTYFQPTSHTFSPQVFLGFSFFYPQITFILKIWGCCFSRVLWTFSKWTQHQWPSFFLRPPVSASGKSQGKIWTLHWICTGSSYSSKMMAYSFDLSLPPPPHPPLPHHLSTPTPHPQTISPHNCFNAKWF